MAETESPWIALANKLLALGYEIAGAAGPELLRNDDHSSGVRLLSVQLIARSLSNMRGVLEMVDAKLIVEARTIARCILENLFWIVGFANDPAKFRTVMLSDDLWRRRSKAQTLFTTGELPDPIEGKLREWMRSNKPNSSRAKTIAPKQLAQDAQIADAYLFYEVLSSDAHPTILALNRYGISVDGKTVTEIDLDPIPTPSELADTIGLACYGLVTVLVSGCQILRSEAAKQVDELARECLRLMSAMAEPAEEHRCPEPESEGDFMSDDLDVMEESPQTNVTKELIQDRVRNWQTRLHDLFLEITVWAQDNGWQVDGTRRVVMHEELMEKFDVPATDQPTLRLDSEHGYALFKPKGLWVIGANGRIDLYTSKGVFILVDLAERGATPRWTIFRASEKRGGDRFKPEMIANLV